jgi:hypothetical protein
MSIPQALYDSEINFSISTFWDGGFDWALGDGINGWHEKGRADTYDAALQALRLAAMKHFPASMFAKSQ